MSFTNETQNYHLPQWVGSDKPTWLVDLNGAFSEIDTGMAATQAQSDATGLVVAGHTSAITALQNTTSDQGSAITGLRTDVDHNTGDISTINSLIGNGTPTTTDKTIIGAINELDAEIDAKIDKKKYLLIGDSYAVGTGVDGAHGWIAQVKTILGLTEGTDVFSYGHGGYGFVGNTGTFASLLAQAISAIADKNSITNIFVAGGFNDIGDNGVPAAITSFINTAKAAFPNAEITIAYNAAYDPKKQTSPTNGQTFLSTKADYCKASGAYKVIPDLYSVLLSKNNYMGDDGIHPSADGYDVLAIATAKAILGSAIPQIFNLETFTIATETGISEGSGMQHYWRRSKDEVRFWFVNFYFTLSSVGGTDNTNAHLKIGTIANAMCNPIGGENVVGASTDFRITTSDGKQHTASGTITITADGSVKVRIPIFKDDGARYSWSEVTLIEGIGQSFAYTIDQLVC